VNERNRRVDGLGRAYAGSQLQIQLWVTRRSTQLTQALLAALPSLAPQNPRIRWVSPLEDGGFAEYQDREFLRAVGLERCTPQLSRFWPRGGPVWDALAAVETARTLDCRGVLLVEAKSHVSEVFGGGCKASARSRKRIEEALELTKRWLGASPDSDWTGALYQSANRLAHLYFFRQVMGVPAWLINVYFINDPHWPTSRAEWEAALVGIKAQLGLAGISVPHTADLFLEAGSRGEPLEERSGPVAG
jgi:hypothetical protein